MLHIWLPKPKSTSINKKLQFLYRILGTPIYTLKTNTKYSCFDLKLLDFIKLISFITLWWIFCLLKIFLNPNLFIFLAKKMHDCLSQMVFVCLHLFLFAVWAHLQIAIGICYTYRFCNSFWKIALIANDVISFQLFFCFWRVFLKIFKIDFNGRENLWFYSVIPYTNAL